MGNDSRQHAPRGGVRVLAKAAVASLVIVLCSGGAVAAAILLQVHKFVNPPTPPHLPPPEPALKGIEVEAVTPGAPRTLLVLASDRRSKRSADAKIGFVPRSDTILLVRLDPKRK